MRRLQSIAAAMNGGIRTLFHRSSASAETDGEAVDTATPPDPSSRYLLGGDNLPLSILPEPALYVEPAAAPFARLKDIIDASDGGVLAVTGERGAGKSMLLRKIADHYSGDGGERNIVIHLASPVGSAKDMDVFVMLFRHLTIAVKNRLLEKGRRAGNDIEAIGREAVRHLNQRVMIVAYGLLIVMMALTLWYVFPVWKRGQIAQLEARLEQVQARPLEADPIYAGQKKALNKAQRTLEATGKFAKTEQISDFKEMQAAFEERDKAATAQKSANVTHIQNEIANKKAESPIDSEYFAAIVAAVIGYPLLIWVYLAFVRRRLRGLTVSEQGLLIYAERIERRLDFEATAGAETGMEFNPLGWLKATGKLTMSEKARPLSLPELTTSYIEFVCQIRRVFPGNIVVCIDELDKITDLEQVRFILREIKGALYVKGSYYVLSISTDGLRSFEGRLADGRDIFESTFDDALTIRGLDVAGCRSILEARVARTFGNAQDRPTHAIITIIAVLSAGNTRELIRTYREWVLLERREERAVAASEVWWMFLERRVQSMIDRLSTASAPPLVADFISVVETMLDEPDKLDSLLPDFARMGKWRLIASGSIPAGLDDVMSLRLARYAAELRILISIRRRLVARLEYGGPDNEQLKLDADRLLAAYQKLPFSLAGTDRELFALHEPVGQQGCLSLNAQAPMSRLLDAFDPA